MYHVLLVIVYMYTLLCYMEFIVEEYISPTPFKDNVGGVFGGAGAFRFVDFSQNCARRFGLNFHHR